MKQNQKSKLKSNNMNNKYLKIWELAKPYYEKGRIYDIEQVTWMTQKAEKIIQTFEVNKDILFPLIILHDIGYSIITNKNPHLKDKNTKIVHMKVGSEIAETILKEVNYDSKLSKIIVYGVSVHDNWVIGDDKPFKESVEMALFNDLDFLYAQSSYEALKIGGQSMGLSPKEMFNFWSKDEKLIRRPFCCKGTNDLFVKQMNKRKKEIDAENQSQKN